MGTKDREKKITSVEQVMYAWTAADGKEYVCESAAAAAVVQLFSLNTLVFASLPRLRTPFARVLHRSRGRESHLGTAITVSHCCSAPVPTHPPGSHRLPDWRDLHVETEIFATICGMTFSLWLREKKKTKKKISKRNSSVRRSSVSIKTFVLHISRGSRHTGTVPLALNSACFFVSRTEPAVRYFENVRRILNDSYKACTLRSRFVNALLMELRTEEKKNIEMKKRGNISPVDFSRQKTHTHSLRVVHIYSTFICVFHFYLCISRSPISSILSPNGAVLSLNSNYQGYKQNIH